MSTLVTSNTKVRNMERMKVLESEMLGDLNNIKIKIWKSDLSEENKNILADTIGTVDNIVQDCFASEYFRAKRIGFI